MKKNLTEEYRNYLIDVIESVEPKTFIEKVSDFFGDLGLKIMSFFGNFNIEDYAYGADDYHRDVLDMKNTSTEQLKKIFEDAWSVDGYFARTTNMAEKNYEDPFLNFLKIMDSLIVSDTCSLKDINIRLGSLRNQLNENIKFLQSAAYSSRPGKYGGNQSSSKNRWVSGEADFQVKMRSIIKQYYPDITDTEITDMLSEMASEGCNFMAMVNTLIAQYRGKEADFEKIFGFSLYDENGNVNFDYIMVDYWLYSGYYDKKKTGLSITTSEKTWEEYLKSKNIKVDVVNIEITVDNWKKLKKDGEIIVSYSPLSLRNENGDIVDDRIEGHATVITDIVEINGKKMYKVSSWGNIYYIDPDDYNDKENSRINYQQVRY